MIWYGFELFHLVLNLCDFQRDFDERIGIPTLI
jgi:hypothetical protein